ncbi:hypothetical protein N7451_009730 [Penicillium sp. IBT 35674x]|nr:hypothetical protein N7451_009730 [Penicillium sp. IBT 35674x]
MTDRPQGIQGTGAQIPGFFQPMLSVRHVSGISKERAVRDDRAGRTKIRLNRNHANQRQCELIRQDPARLDDT